MLIVCGNEECRKEFVGNTVDPYWKCPACDREIENKHFPFLTAKLMEAKASPGKAAWESLYVEHLMTITDFVRQKTALIERTIPGFEMPKEHKLDDLANMDKETVFDQKSFDLLLTRGHATAIYLIDVLKKKDQAANGD